MTNWYQVLEVSESASPDVIKATWRLLQQKYHPDNPATGNLERSKQINLAYETLGDPDARAKFDAELAKYREAAGAQYQQHGWPGAAGPADFVFDPNAYPMAYGPMDLGEVAREVLFDASIEIGGAFLNNVMHQMSPFARKMFVDAIERRRQAQRQATQQKKKTG